MTRKLLILEVITRPDPVLKTADTTSTKKLSFTIFVVSAGFLFTRSTAQVMQHTQIPTKKKYFHGKNLTAINKHGKVITSPTDVIKGAVTLSGSQPLEKLWTATRRVNTRMNILEITPPTTDMTTRSTTEIDAKPKMDAATREMTASSTETVSVRNRDAAIFPVITGARSSREISPTCRAVLMRDPSVANMLPLIPMAAGTMIINPGSSPSMSENVPRYIPPKSDPKEAKTREIMPCLKTAALLETNSSLSAKEITAVFFSFMEILTRWNIVVP